MTRTMAIVVGLALASATTSWRPQAQGQTPTPDPSLIRVFVGTDDTGQEQELAARRDSVRDLATALQKKKKLVVVVTDKDGADIEMDVVDRSLTVPKVIIGLGAGGRQGDPTTIPGMSTPVRQAVLRVAIKGFGETLVVTNKNKPAESTQGWKSAAEDIANQAEKWISARRDEIIKKRR